MEEFKFARHTAAIIDQLPYWFKIRKYPHNSDGARYLNITGKELDEMRCAIAYAYEQCYIESVDVLQADFCYKTILPMEVSIGSIKAVYEARTALIRAKDLKQFFGIGQNIHNQNMHSYNFYYIDEKRNIIYVRKKFNADAINDNGKIIIELNNGMQYIAKLVPHQVWNYLDEIGSLMSCPRIPEEPNIEYQKRIMDVFKNYAGASRDGLINGIGRELALRRIIKWTDTSKDLELEDPMIVLNSIKINGIPVLMDNIYITESGTVLIKAHFLENEAEITYVYGLEMHQMHNRKDIKFYNELFTIEEKPKNKLKEYIEILNSESPIFWNNFKWNEHFWNQNDKDVSGVGFIPNLYNGSIAGFKKYKKGK